MGVPSFYRWLVNKYPEIAIKAVEQQQTGSTSTAPAPAMTDTSSSPNPNGFEFDNLYLDMNGIIHPCFHPADDDRHNVNAPATFDKVFENIFDYMDCLFNIVRPRKLLFIAIDGVAPRAKMNQQRSRRFRTSRDSAIVEMEEERLKRQFRMEGKVVKTKEESEVSDSNVITPGTHFMHKLSEKLQSYIQLQMNNDPGWKGIEVILSDANVPGEGEHKVMSFIRFQRSFAGYDPNTVHCLYGLDADLIMLALATHEVHFYILREDVLQDEKTFSELSLKSSNGLVKQQGLKENMEKEHSVTFPVNKKKRYQFLSVSILRQYLEIDLEVTNPYEKFKADLERLLDDFIFICFFAGNDFLPHMPTLQIHEGAIDLLMHVYKQEFKNLGGYLVDMQRAEDKKGGFIKLKRVEKFILCIGTYEEKIFKRRKELRERKLKQILQADFADAEDNEEKDLGLELNEHCINHERQNGADPSFLRSAAVSDASMIDKLTDDDPQILQNTIEFNEKLKDFIQKTADVSKNSLLTDKVKLSEVGFKRRYYKEKFCADSQEDMERMRKAVVEKYTEGLCWVLLYYFSGVPSWSWFYPFHYGPFASDLKGLSQTRLRFEKGSPFKPFDQLMAVLPPKSAHALPLAYRQLMTDEYSEIIDFYPTEFEVDTGGKRFSWQGICKLPFIEEERLLARTKELEKELNEEETIRNAQGDDRLFTRSFLGSAIISLYKNQASMTHNGYIKIDTSSRWSKESVDSFMCFKLEAKNVGDSDCPVEDGRVICVYYQLPPPLTHIPRPLEGVIFPERTLSVNDIVQNQLWHEYRGSRPSHGFQNQGNIRKPSSSPINLSSGVIIKEAGSGFAGRGKMCSFPSNSQRHNDHTRTPGERMAREMKFSNKKWKVEDYGRGGIENLRISDSSYELKSSGRGGDNGNHVRPQFASGAIMGFNNGNQGYWRPTSVQAAANPTPGRGNLGYWRPTSVQAAANRPPGHSNLGYWRPTSVQAAANPPPGHSNVGYWRPTSVQVAANPQPGPGNVGYWRPTSVQAAVVPPPGHGNQGYWGPTSVQAAANRPPGRGSSNVWRKDTTENANSSWQCHYNQRL